MQLYGTSGADLIRMYMAISDRQGAHVATPHVLWLFRCSLGAVYRSLLAYTPCLPEGPTAPSSTDPTPPARSRACHGCSGKLAGPAPIVTRVGHDDP
jgi:hypothetical protein